MSYDSMRSPCVLVLFLTLALTACGDRAPRDGNDEPELELVALPLIAGDLENPELTFGAIAGVEIGDDGSVFILDRMNRRVLVFDEDGEVVRTFGRRGRGPDELERPSHLLWRRAGELWVADPGNGRYSVFDANGEFITTYRHADPGSVSHPWAVGFSAEGLLYVVTSGPDLMQQKFWMVECEAVDGEVHELRRFELPFVEPPVVFEHSGEDMVLALLVPFSSAPLLAIGRGGELWRATTREPWLHRHTFGDTTAHTVGRDFEPPSVSRAELQALLDADPGIEELRTSGGPSVHAKFMSLVPDTKPHLDGFFFDDDGNVWVMRSARAEEDARHLDVFEPNGSLIATARAALEVEPRPRARGGLIVGVVRDELGVEAIARYRAMGPRR